MGAINVVESDEIEWLSARGMALNTGVEIAEEDLAHYETIDVHGRNLHPGGANALWLNETRYGPNIDVPSHAHDADEIIYITEGELHLGRRILSAGSSVAIAAHTLYGFRSGPSGLTFLLFRATSGVRHISKAEHMSMRQTRG